MRRRQPAAGGGDRGLGIFVLTPPGHHGVSGERESARRQRGKLGISSIISWFRVLAMISCAVLLLAPKKKSPKPSTAHGIDGNGTAASRGKGGGDPAPPGGLAAGPPRIPRRLIFTYKYNLIAPSVNDPPFDGGELMTSNVLRTIETYQKYWADADANASSAPRQGPEEEVVVSFLSDNGCLEVIAKAEPRLVEYFHDEKRGEFRADMCRVAELYLFGGYYFDVDIGVVEPVDLDALHLPSQPPEPIRHLTTKELSVPGEEDLVTFATVCNSQGRYFQAFTAAMPRHPVMKRSLDYFVAFYEGTLEKVLPKFMTLSIKEKHGLIPNRGQIRGMGVGPFTLYVAHRTTMNEEWEEYVKGMVGDPGYSGRQERESNRIPAKRRYTRFLYEMSLQDEGLKKRGIFQDFPLQDANYTIKVPWCNFVCFEGRRIYFYSRVPGSKGCPEEKRLAPPYH